MNRFVIWLIYLWLWWTIDNRRDEVLRRFARGYWMRIDWLIRFGVVATAILLVSAILFSLSNTCSVFPGKPVPVCEMRLIAFWYAPANEVGDTLAGLAGALAFLWLVLTVLIQGKELSAQRQELSLTRMEMKEQRKATQDMASSMSAQSKIFEDEQRRRDELRAKEHLEELLELLYSNLTDAKVHCKWEYERRYLSPSFNLRQMVEGNDVKPTLPEDFVWQKESMRLFTYERSANEAVLWSLAEQAEVSLRAVQKLDKVKHRSKAPLKHVLPIIETLEELLQVCERLSEDQRVRVSRLRLERLLGVLEQAKTLDVWMPVESSQ